jgi:polar amino acid transport system permease protein
MNAADRGPVGWVERSETHHGHFHEASPSDGFRFAQPILRGCEPISGLVLRRRAAPSRRTATDSAPAAGLPASPERAIGLGCGLRARGRPSRRALGALLRTRSEIVSQAPQGTNNTLPVLKPFRLCATTRRLSHAPLTATHGGLLLLALALATGAGEAQAGPGAPSVFATLLRWTPLLAQGFALNIAMSFLAMAIGTALGLMLGLGLISLVRPVQAAAWLVTQFFRNAPWLVLLFYCILLMPFELNIGGATVPLPGWAKATAGLALPVMANVAELVRGAVQSIPAGQWEAAEALAFTRLQTLRLVILPQCVKRMTPPWMNLYAIVVVATPLTSIVGVSEAMTLTGDVLSSEGRTELLVPMYLYLLMWFFIYCYPIARATAALERRFQVSQKVS